MLTASLAARPAADDGALTQPALLSHDRLRPLQLPGIEQRAAYSLAYLRDAVRGRRPGPAAPRQHGGGYATELALTPTLRGRWHAFYRTDPSRAIPYFYAQAAATLLLRRLFADLGLAPGQVRHLRQVTCHVRGAEPAACVPLQRLSCRLQRIDRSAGGTVVVVTDMLLASADGHALALLEDTFACTGIDASQLAALPRERDLVAGHAALRRQAPQLPRMDANLGEWVIGLDWGRRYAALSGQMQPRHLVPLAARLLRGNAAVLQPSALRNLVVRHLADVGLMPERLVIDFCRPVLLGDRVGIVQRDDRYEVVDGRGRLVARGDC